ncbi:hypothetical protein [Foetidibacter luteolus]|uniref:hypothetical protein n=1 Tax=Foetidibacter luteolus TaxID=2608880 RepID=UPI00129BC146|nr:hypothetical protein [Foetidibacter luteolus]
MLTVLDELKVIKANISEMISLSGYKDEYIANKIGMSCQSFAAKKQRGNWTREELEKVMNLLMSVNEDVINFYDALIITQNTTDNSVSSEEFEKRMGWS